MHNLELQNLKLVELNQTEQVESNGGWLLPVVAAAAIVQIFSDWDNFKAGIAGQPEK